MYYNGWELLKTEINCQYYLQSLDRSISLQRKHIIINMAFAVNDKFDLCTSKSHTFSTINTLLNLSKRQTMRLP